MNTVAARFDATIAAAIPRDAFSGLSIGRIGDKSTWIIRFTDAATDAHKAAAASALAAFDPNAPTPDQVAAERDRRLALGFTYAFGDARGSHRIGTTKADLDGWSEVSTYAGALLDSGDITTKIAIVTDTGPCEVTAPEWRAIEIAAAQYRQPLWAKSFALMTSNPIPADYTDDRHWT